MSKINFKNGLIALGVTAAIAAGIVAYNVDTDSVEPIKFITIEERDALIQAYNSQLNNIKKNCDTDTRCVKVDGEKRVNFGVITSKQEVKDSLDTWIEESVSEPNKYNKIK
jgi:hypothetical protein|tara:strand:+ start:235 stop:567 length:333 start_codon:yes stop_codon:yes gene_type:complete